MVVPATVAVMVSVRLVLSIGAPVTLSKATAEKGMVTIPDPEVTPELVPSCPVPLVKVTVDPETAILFGSVTVAVMVAEVDPSDLTVALEVAREISSEDEEILIGIWAVAVEPTTVAVTVSVRSVRLMTPLGETAEYGMVTVPVPDETPELAPRVPPLALNLTVTPDTGRLLKSTTLAVIVAEFEPSGLIDALELLSMTSNALAEILMGICAVTLVPTTLAVTVSVRSVVELAEYGMVTSPDVDDRPELTPSVPPVALNLTVAPATGKLLASTTCAVMVVDVEPSVFADGAVLLSMREAAVAVVEFEVLPVAPPPPPHPARPITPTSNAPVRNT